MNRKKIEKNSISESLNKGIFTVILILTLTLTAYCLLPTAYCFGWSSPVAIDAGPSNA